MTVQTLPQPRRALRKIAALRIACGLGIAVAAAVMLIGPARVIAQIEGDRGIAPVVASGDILISGITVNTTGKTAAEARATGWKAAYRLAWAQAHGPDVGDDTIAGLVSAVVVGREMIGPHRYIATLGIQFDRSRAGPLIGGATSVVQRSAPLLVIPVLYSGGVAQVYEIKGAWQRAWAEFPAGLGAISYVRPTGGGGDSLLITAGQPGRRSRLWWHGILDQYGAGDVIAPMARLERQWPGGPINGSFTARYGPDNQYLDSFTLTAPEEGAVPDMLKAAVTRFDQIYTDALVRGVLRSDPSLSLDHPKVDPALAEVIAAGQRAAAAQAAAAPGDEVTAPGEASAAPSETKPGASFSVQFASPDAGAVDGALAGVRGVPGVSGAGSTSIAIGGTSVMRVTYAGSLTELAAALRARGWQVTAGSGALRIKR